MMITLKEFIEIVPQLKTEYGLLVSFNGRTCGEPNTILTCYEVYKEIKEEGRSVENLILTTHYEELKTICNPATTKVIKCERIWRGGEYGEESWSLHLQIN